MNDAIDYIALGQRIRSVRKACMMTQEQLGEICSLSAAHIGHIERGTRKASLDTIYRISIALKVSIDYLVFDSSGSNGDIFAGISSILKTKNKEKVSTFINTVKILVDKIDDM